MNVIYDRTRDTFTTSGYNLIPLNPYIPNDQYPNFITDMNTALHSVGYIDVTIYTDASGNSFGKDSNGNDINQRLLVNTTYNYLGYDASGYLYGGYMTIRFEDGSTFGNTDTNDSDYWYVIYNADPTIKQYT